MAVERQLDRLRYSPHFEYVKELILSEGVKHELPSWMIERIAHAPSAVVAQLRSNKREIAELIESLRQRLGSVTGFDEYDAWLSRGMPDETEADWQAMEAGPHRVDVLLFRTMLQLHQATDMTERMLVQLGGEPDAEREQADIRRWVSEETEKRRLQEDVRLLLPRLVDGVSTDLDRQHAEATARLSEIEHGHRVRERQLVDKMAVAFAPSAQAVRDEIPRMRKMVYGGLVYHLKGNPEPLLNTVLEVLLEKRSVFTSVAAGVRTLRRAMELTGHVRGLMTQQTVRLATSTFIQPARRLLDNIASQVSTVQKEIFWPLFDILELLSGTDDSADESIIGLNQFAQSLVDFIETVDKGATELVKEAKRFDRSLMQGLRDSLGQIELLQQIESYAEMFERLLASIESLPVDLTKASERRRLVSALVEGEGWRQADTPTDEEAAVDSVRS